MITGEGAGRSGRRALRMAPFALAVLALGATTPAAGTEALPHGDAAAGRALFTGERALAGGGAPCGACHATGGERAPFAASFGPELSRSFEGMDAAAMDGLLQDLPFPTMAPIFTGHALTSGERADLGAYLLQGNGEPAPRGEAIALQAALGAGVLAALVAAAGRRRKRPTRPTLPVHPPRGGAR